MAGDGDVDHLKYLRRFPGPCLSLEFFPPKSVGGWTTLYSTLGEVGASAECDFVSVTCGAGGQGAECMQDAVALSLRCTAELGLKCMAHCTCVSSSKEDICNVLSRLHKGNIAAVMALRGDLPPGQKSETYRFPGFEHASGLIDCIHKQYPDMCIGCAAYPEKHPEAASLDEDIGYLKEKQDLGARFAVTQLFFDNSKYFSFVKRAQELGVHIPIVAGIMPVSSLKDLSRAKLLSNCSVPERLAKLYEDSEDDDLRHFGRRKLALQISVDQCLELLRNGVPGLHFYTLNKLQDVEEIIVALREHGYFMR